MSADTLLDIFVPPEGMVGHSAALVAMTGAEDFLEDAVERFTGLRPRQRAELGNVLVYLMLDGHASSSRQEVLPPGRIPGLHEFQPREVEPGSLLHAKVALLAFASNRTGGPVHLRLAVLTANYTYTSARQQLELAWVVDLPLIGSARVEDRADVAAAGAFVETILARRFHRDEQTLPLKEHKLTARLDVLLATASSLAPASRKPRFIHSLDRPLYDQIRERMRSAIDKPRNLLLCGSGFYEEPSAKARKPAVFGKLEDLGVFTTNARRVALVEPGEAGAVATWARGGDTEGWEVVRPYDALDQNRRLHAKFVYAGYLRDGHVSNGWLYLGSGNLSRRGMLTHGGMAEGNVEAGVVLAVDERLDGEAIERWLFWSDEAETIGDQEWTIGQVGDAPDAQPILEAPPILSAMIQAAPSRHLRLLWRDDFSGASRVRICWTGRNWLDVKQGDEVPLQNDENPAALNVSGGSDRRWVVPVADAAGRVGWQPPRFDTYADALAALLDFPIRPTEASDDGDGDDGEGVGTNGVATVAAIEQKKSYALHAAAELIEKVAALQAALPESMLDDWLDHLDRMFRGAFPEPLIATWRMHRLDVFAHLREPELRSPLLTDKQRVRYFEVLDGAARAWGLR
ncbi:hypothetical protein ACM43_12180 [Bradyrhizobium sp. CCBAU 45321]|uniref:hypothetical protein n=1 Tax=Bradyrhizobium sp. CCBAU 45321 TaxID=1641878 RepID=UPI002304B238|nr:hypothetical protein [Bradyrhizobium sp. CCBAU 45321]MDA9545186.1 hypothetical protein [Bradyrhizobium sp. CCBAU 45321]